MRHQKIQFNASTSKNQTFIVLSPRKSHCCIEYGFGSSRLVIVRKHRHPTVLTGFGNYIHHLCGRLGFPGCGAWAMRNSTFPSRDRFQETYSKAKIPFSWPSSIPSLIPHRMRRKLRSKVRSRQSPSSSFASIETSVSPADTLQALRAHRWSFYDGQYVILVILGIFTLCIIPSPGPLAKTGVSTLLLASLIIPATRQVFLPLLPVITWLGFFYACGYVVFFYRLVPRSYVPFGHMLRTDRENRHIRP